MKLAREARTFAFASAFAFAIAAPAFAQGEVAPAHVTVDSVAVRFHAPDTGGPATPRFITSRILSFEARLLALEEDPQGVVQARHVRAAVEAHIVEEMLASLPLERGADAASLAKTVDVVRVASEQRVGGRAAIEHAQKLDGIGSPELDAILQREARAAVYIDRAISPVLTYTEDQLRETYRTTSHPYRTKRFEECRDDLARWLVLERFRSTEQAYLQTARARVTIVYF